MEILTSSTVEQPPCTGAQTVFAHPVENGSPTCGQAGCIMLPAATLVNCAYTIIITKQFRRLAVPLIVNLLRSAREPAMNNGCGPLP